MARNKITGREREIDSAEKWLAENDPDYANQKRNWQTPSTDALARDRNEHHSMRDLQNMGEPGDGNYRRVPMAGPSIGREFKNQLTHGISESDEDGELERS